MKWIYTFKSQIGTAHSGMKTPCQDSSVCKVINTSKDGRILTAIAADGAGSAKKADAGSKLECLFIMREIEDFFKGGNELRQINRDTAAGWVIKYQKEVRRIAGIEGLEAKDFACTLIAAVIGVDAAVYFQIGDGAIVVSTLDKPGEYSCIFWPQQGEYENTTYFATDPYSVKCHFNFRRSEHAVEEMAIFTDGIQRLALQYKSRSPYRPFFQPLFRYLRSVRGERVDIINKQLGVFLKSDKINERTDDDKTLILAVRSHDWGN